MELTTEDVLEINTALQTLSDSKDTEELRAPEVIEEAAKIVIKYANSLKRGGLISAESYFAYDSDSNFTGKTEHGNITINEKKSKKVEKSYGVNKERIGHYRLWLSPVGDIYFHHFWKSDLMTEGSDGPVTKFRISYDPISLQVLHFGYEVKKHWLRLGPITIGKNLFEPIYGTGTFVEGYFLQIRIRL